MSTTAETVSCGVCGQSFETDLEKKHHVQESHANKSKDWKQRSLEWAEKML